MTKSKKTAEIICVGTELLLGQTLNTNAAWLADQLQLAGAYVFYQTVVGDNCSRLRTCLELALARSDIVILTGGLGPTQDDMTCACVAQVVGLPLVFDLESAQALKEIFLKMGRKEITENNWKQAYLPKTAVALPNLHGTAPGCRLNIDYQGSQRTVVLLPGPPREMEPMFTNEVLPWLKQEIKGHLQHVFIRMVGIGESKAESLFQDLISSQVNPTIATYASAGEVVFRITQAFKESKEQDLIAPLVTVFKERAEEYIYEIGRRSLPEVVRDLLLAKGETVSLAESCTGGLLAKQLTDLPQASRIFPGGVVAYSNDVKMDVLSVPAKILDEQGAVSPECAVAMASGCRNFFKSDWSVAVTGIAGPDGATPTKPLGTVFIAVACRQQTQVRELKLTGDRDRIRHLAALNAYRLIWRMLNGAD